MKPLSAFVFKILPFVAVLFVSACAQTGVKTLTSPETGVSMDSYWVSNGGLVSVGCVFHRAGNVLGSGSCPVTTDAGVQALSGAMQAVIGASGLIAGGALLSGIEPTVTVESAR